MSMSGAAEPTVAAADEPAAGSPPGATSPGPTAEPDARRGGRAREVLDRAVRSVWLWPSLLTLLLGAWRMGRPQLWQDELVTLDVTRRPVARIWALLGNVDAVHGFYYLVMHFWTAVFGDSVWSLRAPSTLAMAGAAACVALAGSHLFGRWAGLLAGLVFAVVPSVTRFAQEARSYAFVTLMAALATVLFLRACRVGRWPAWLAYALSLAALGYLHLPSASVLVGHALAALVLPLRDTRRWVVLLWFTGSVALAAAATIPVITAGNQQASTQISWIPHTTLRAVWPQIYASHYLGWCIVLCAALALLRPSRRLLVAFLVAATPVLVIDIASRISVNYLFGKYLLFTVPAWAVLAGAGLAAVRWRSLSVAGLCVLTVAALPGQRAMRQDLSHIWYTYPSAPATTAPPRSYHAVADLIASRYQPGDAIAYSRVLWWYLQDVGVEYYLPHDVRPTDVFLGDTAEQVDGLFPTECLDSAACLSSRGGPRIWLVVPNHTRDVLGAFSPAQHDALGAAYTVTDVVNETGFTVALAVRR
jgi:mannosyltransferase